MKDEGGRMSQTRAAASPVLPSALFPQTIAVAPRPTSRVLFGARLQIRFPASAKA
jgi:hypothetical protein